MAAEPNAREIARRLIDEVLAERSLSRPRVSPGGTPTDGGGPAARRDGPRGPATVATSPVDPAARTAARRLVDEVLSDHGLRIAGRGGAPEPASDVAPQRVAPAASAPGRGPDGDVEPRVTTQSAIAARRIVDEVLRAHEQAPEETHGEVPEEAHEQTADGPPPVPSRQERERREAARHGAQPSNDLPQPSAVLISDVRADVDPATAARRIVERVLRAHEAVSSHDADPYPSTRDSGPIPSELFSPVPAQDADEAADEAVDEAADPVIVDVTDGTGPDGDGTGPDGTGPDGDVTDGDVTDGDGTRTVARMVADVMAARAVTVEDAADAHGSPGDRSDDRVTQVVAERDTRVIAGPDIPRPAATEGLATDTSTEPAVEATRQVDVGMPEDVRPEPDELDELDDDWSAVVPVSAYAPDAEDTVALEQGSWPEPTPPRRTGRWLLTTVLGAVALAYLFPLAVRAVRDLVALS